MGLDTFAVRGTEDDFQTIPRDEAEIIFTGVQLAGDDVLDTGRSSFRGRAYDALVSEATGFSLYERWIAPEDVAEMSAAFDRWLVAWEEAEGLTPLHLTDPYLVVRHLADPAGAVGAAAQTAREFTNEELRAVGRFLQICKANGFGLHGWW